MTTQDEPASRWRAADFGNEGVRFASRKRRSVTSAARSMWPTAAPIRSRRWARDEGRSRLDPRPGALLQAARPSSHAGPRRQRPRHDRAVPGHAGHACRVRPRPGPAAEFRRLPLPLRAAARRERRGRGCPRRSAPPRPCRTSTRIAAGSCCSRSAKARRPRRAGRTASRCSGRSGSRRSTSPPRPKLGRHFTDG